MPKFALAYPYFIIMVCLVVAVVGVTTMIRTPVDLFPQINIRVVVVATFDRKQASLLGLRPKNVDHVIAALTSDGMIAPSYWIDPKTGNDNMLTVRYFNEKMVVGPPREGMPCEFSSGMKRRKKTAITERCPTGGN